MLDYIDYILFLGLMMFKLYWFTKLTDTVFSELSFSEYISLFIDWLGTSGNEGFADLFKGIAMISIGAILLLSFWILFLPRRGRLIAILTVNILLTFIMFADLIYYRYFEDLISITVLEQAGQVGALGDSITNLFTAADWLFFVDLFILIPLTIYAFIKTSRSRVSKKRITARIISAGFVFVIGYVFVSAPIKDFLDKGGSYLFEKTISNMRVYEVTGLLGFHGYNAYEYVNENILHNNRLTAEEKGAVQAWFQLQETEPKSEPSLHGIAEGKNVILVQLEAIQNFVIDHDINGQEITPHLNQLKKDSLYFERFYHQVALGRTSDAEFLTQASFYPMNGGSAYISYSGNTFMGMPKMLKEKGYTTAAFHAYKKSFWNRYLMYPALGIDTFYSLDTFEQDEPLGWSIADESMLTQSVEKMKRLEEPFYSFLVTLTSHHPYDLPDEYKKLDVEGVHGMTFKNYLQSVHYVDQAVGTFIDELKRADMWENSVVIFYGDHDSGLLKEGSEMEAYLGVKDDPLGSNQMRGEVPLLIHLPEGDHAGVYDQIGGQIDLGPTILDLLGVPVNENYMMGTSLFDEEEKMVVFRTSSFYTEDVFYKASKSGGFEDGACYDMHTGDATPLQTCKKDHDRALKQLEISDQVLKENLIKEFVEKNETH